MSYIKKIISPQEKLMVQTRLHWIYLVESILWFAGIFIFGLVTDHYLTAYADAKMFYYYIDIFGFQFDRYRAPVPYIFAAMGLFAFWSVFSVYISTEIGLTDRRIIHKKGLIMIDIQQIELEDIRAEDVNHGIFGWLFKYGRIHFDCRFIDDIYLPAIREPYRLVKAVHTARMRHEKVVYTEDDLDADLNRIDIEVMKTYRARENLRKLSRAIMLDFRKAH